MKIQKSMIIQSQRLSFIALSMTLLACGQQQQGYQTGIPEYAVTTIEPTSIELNKVFPATIRGRQDIEIRPNVSGFITELCVDEGSVVQKGQTLFIIDPVQYEEAVNVARAAVEVAKSNVATAKLTAENKRELEKKNIISQYDLEMAENTLASQEAALAQAQANLVNAEKNLSYTRVISPSNGVVGTIPFRVGSLVGPTSTTPLTVVSDISEMYVYFSMNEKDILNMTREGSTKEVLSSFPAVQLKLPDGSIYAEKGKIETISGVIDPTTGAATVRATFKNPNRILRSGGSGVVLLPEQDSAAVVIPQKATSEIQDKKYAFIVTDSSTVKMQEIKILSLDDGKQYVVTDGLKPGDRIVIEGVGTSIREGMTIKPITPEESAAKLQGAAQQIAGMGAAQ
ncbi:MAG TPA: efflux RND transporter periplasmic adaptor subunit [Candidatus Avirikenella pullistercoris]|nr:efflux RND transporter periplasmic adaptor subunit [Candidatus Avirikenella pullistercoris]